MMNDERDRRDERDPTPDEQPIDDQSSDAADEFETAPWPVQDTAPHQEAMSEAPVGPVPDEPANEEPVPDAPEDWPAAEPGPPPPEVEAYAASTAAATEEALSETQPAHTVPATEPGESTQCPRCGTENRPGIAFCRNCGQRLVAAGAAATVERPSVPEGTQACPRCGTHNRAGVAFCQNCGANMRGPEPGASAAEDARTAPRGGAVLGPIVLLLGAVGVVVGWLLPFALGAGSLFDRSFGATDGYGIAFWTGYEEISGFVDQAYFGFAAPSPLLVVLLVALAIGGFLRAQPGVLQLIGLVVAVIWALGLAALFVIVELLGGPGGDLIDILRALSPGGIILFLAALIILIGSFTRLARG
jgi:hypothetical protein